MRPPGEIREAARRAAWDQVSALNRGVTWRDIAAQLVPQCIGRAAAKYAVKNMAAAGELVPLELVRVPGVSRRLRAYAPAGHPLAAPPYQSALDLLSQALQGGNAMT